LLWSSTSDAALAALNTERQRSQERMRRDRFARRAKLLGGDYLDLVKDELLTVFKKPDVAAHVAVLSDTSVNVFRYVTEETFHYRGAKRAFKVGTSEDPVYRRISDRVEDFDLRMGEVALALGALNDCVIQVLPGIVRDDNTVDKPFVRLFLPHELTVLPDPYDPSKPAEVRYEQYDAKGDKHTVVWNAREHYLLGERGVQRAPGMEGLDNPYGRVPFVAVHAGARSDWFWDEDTGQDRYQFTLQWLADWADVRFTMHQQGGYRQVVITGADQTDEEPQYTGPGSVWLLSNGKQVTTLDMTADISQRVDALKTKLAAHLASHGLNPERLGMNPGQAPPSGLARYLERQELLERRKTVKPFLEAAEWDFAELYRFMWNWNQPEQISEKAEFDAELIEETVVLSPLEQADLRNRQLMNYQKERELGLATKLEQVAKDRSIPLEVAASISSDTPAKPEIFAYDQENGVVTVDEIRASKNLGPHPNREIGSRTVPELKALHPEWFGINAPTTPAQAPEPEVAA
jgi:hypothetical protein